MCIFAIPSPACGFQLLSPPSADLPLESKQSIQQMLGPEWSLSESKQTPSTFAKAPKSNSAVLLSYALNRFEYGTKDQGLEISKEMSRRFPTNLDGWMLTLWFEALVNDYDKSLITVQSFHNAMSQQPQLDDQTKQTIYRRLGKLIGYFEGPVHSSVNEDLLIAARNTLTKDLPADLLKTFNDARSGVTKKFNEMKQSQANVEVKELAKAKIVNDEESQRIEADNQRLEETQTRLEPQKATIRSQANSEISILEQQASSALAQLNTANANVNSIELDLFNLYTQWNINHQNNYYGDDFFLRTRIQQAEYALSQARASAFSLGGQVATLRNQLIRTRRNYNGQLSQIDSEINAAAKAIRRNNGKLNRLARGPKVADGKRSGRKNRLTSLRTYDDLSLDLYRQQLLNATK
ncbi:MAG: hypothetical protein AAFN77_22170 [Planctomycetota bacterium]